MKNKIISLVLILIIISYLFSYILIRKNNTVITEMDGCPIDGCSYVYFEQGKVSLAFTPLIILDRRITHTEFIFTGWKS